MYRKRMWANFRRVSFRSSISGIYGILPSDTNLDNHDNLVDTNLDNLDNHDNLVDTNLDNLVDTNHDNLV